MKKLKTLKNILIGGEFHADEGDTIDELRGCGAAALDRLGATDVILFQGNDGKWYVGSFEFCIDHANPELVKDTLREMAECDNCGNIEPSDGLDEITDYEERVDENTKHPPAGQCSKCGALSYEITSRRAAELAKGKP